MLPLDLMPLPCGDLILVPLGTLAPRLTRADRRQLIALLEAHDAPADTPICVTP